MVPWQVVPGGFGKSGEHCQGRWHRSFHAKRWSVDIAEGIEGKRVLWCLPGWMTWWGCHRVFNGFPVNLIMWIGLPILWRELVSSHWWLLNLEWSQARHELCNLFEHSFGLVHPWPSIHFILRSCYLETPGTGSSMDSLSTQTGTEHQCLRGFWVRPF